MLTKGKLRASAPRSARAAAINFKDADELVKVKVGAIVLATGFELVGPLGATASTAAGGIADVIDGFAFERLASASGPTGGRNQAPQRRDEPQDGRVRAVLRQPRRKGGEKYCSKICCMYTAKHAMLYRAQGPWRAGRGLLHGHPRRRARATTSSSAAPSRRTARSTFAGASARSTAAGRQAHRPRGRHAGRDAGDDRGGHGRRWPTPLCRGRTRRSSPRCSAWPTTATASTARRTRSSARWRRPSPGVYLAGACQGPKDIPESVAQASAAAAKVLGLFAQPKLEREPVVARVNRITCAHCRACINACPYKAIEDFNILDRSGKVLRTVAKVNEGLCQGCGTCVSVCRSQEHRSRRLHRRAGLHAELEPLESE